MPSKYGNKYRCGLVQGPASQVFVSRGLGEAGVPLRLNCPPEINLLTLTPFA
jgi:predicted MPP superfamily phosphohydrolase